jgi:hypothetical protein
MVALLFHVRAACGEAAAYYSQREALEGIISLDGKHLICAPCGLSQSAWTRANRALEESGVLRRVPQFAENGSRLASQYTLQWPVIRAKIKKWQEAWEENNTVRLAKLEQEGWKPDGRGSYFKEVVPGEPFRPFPGLHFPKFP